jgi:hypothetical protein
MSLKDEAVYSGKITKKTEIDSTPPTQDSLISKLQTIYQSSLEQNLSLSESQDFPVNSSTLFSSNLEEDNSKLSSSKIDTNSHIKLTQKAILNSFNNRRTTLILQKILFEVSKEELENIVNELCGKYRQSIKDKNGNYFCSDLFKVCNQNQRIKVLKELSNTICDDCVDSYATHPIQTLIEFSSCEEEYILLLKSFNDYNKLTFASIDPFGSYVLTKIIGHIPEKFRMKFNSLYVSIICPISTKKFGAINAKKFVLCTKNDLIIRKLIDLVKDNFVNLALNYYGKYLIQNFLDKWWNTSEGEEIKEQIRENLKELFTNSNGHFIIGHYYKLANKEEKIQFNQVLNIISNNNMFNKDNFMKEMESLGQNNNNQNILSSNNFDNNNHIFNNSNQMPLLLNNFGSNNNNIINSNQIPLSLNNFGNNNNNIINCNQIPFSLNNYDNNNMRNNLALNNFNQKDNYFKNNNIRK